MKRTMSWNAGFTFLEMLVVLTIIGILMAVGFPNLTTWQIRSTVDNAAQQFARDIDRQRIETKRLNASKVINVINSSSYVAGTETRIMPPGTTVVLNASTMSNPLTFYPPYGTFYPPYGTTEPIAPIYTIRSTRNSSIFRTVRIVSLLGKVVVQ